MWSPGAVSSSPSFSRKAYAFFFTDGSSLLAGFVMMTVATDLPSSLPP